MQENLVAKFKYAKKQILLRLFKYAILSGNARKLFKGYYSLVKVALNNFFGVKSTRTKTEVVYLTHNQHEKTRSCRGGS